MSRTLHADHATRSWLTAIRQRARAEGSDDKSFDAAVTLLSEIDMDDPPPVVVHAKKMPRIEIQPKMKLDSGTISDDVLMRWNAGLRAQTSDAPNVIKMFGVIGYDFWSGGGITADSVAQALDDIGNKDVEVHINSPGGDMFEGIAIYNILQGHSRKVTVKVMGLAASAASVIAMAGSSIEIGQGAFLMIHNCWVAVMGNRIDLRDIADYLEPFDQSLRDIYKHRTGQKPEDISQWMDDETFLSAQDAIDKGFADKLMESKQIVEDSVPQEVKAINAKRLVESNLCHKGRMSRTQARAVMKLISKPSAAESSAMQDAGATAKQDAGDVIKGIEALINTIKA